MQIVDVTTGKNYVARKRVNRASKSNMTIADFLVHTSYGSTRGTNGKGVPEMTRSEVSSSFPERRAALVIGNSNYMKLASLRNAQSDAVAVSDELLSLGFDVMQLYECEGEDMKTALTEFCRNAAGYDFVLFYYAGHGIQDDGRNYLVPVDKSLDFKSELRDCLECDDVAQRFDALSAESRMIVLDACRNTKKTWSRSADEGLARMEAGRGSVILFSTESGRVALDGEGDHSPFATALLSNIMKPGLQFSDVVNGIVRDTYNATEKKQYPMLVGTLLTDFSFNSSGSAATSGSVAQSVPAATSSSTPATHRQEPEEPVYQFVKTPSNIDIRPISTRCSGGKCIMEFAVTNLGRKLVSPGVVEREDRESFMIDSEGNTYSFRSFGGGGNWMALGSLPPGVPVRKRVVINDFDPEVTSFATMFFNFRSTGNGAMYGIDQMELRNVPMGLKEPFPAATPSSANKVNLTVADVDVSVKSVTMVGNTATITFLFHNNTGSDMEPTTLTDEPMSAYAHVTQVIDDQGNILSSDNFELPSYRKFSLPAGIPVKLTVKVRNISQQARSLPYFGLALRNIDADASYGAAYLTVRNIPLR